MADPKLTDEQRLRCQDHRLSPDATDHDVASEFVYGAGNLYRDGVAHAWDGDEIEGGETVAERRRIG